MNHRPDNALLRRARQTELASHGLRLIDLLALVVGYGLILSIIVAGAISIADWVEGLPHTVLPELARVLARRG